MQRTYRRSTERRDEPLQMRIGIAAGDAMVEDHDASERRPSNRASTISPTMVRLTRTHRAGSSRCSGGAPLIRADRSRLDTGGPQRSQHSAGADTPLRGHYHKGTAREVQLGGFVEIDSIGNAVPHLDARSAQVPGEGAPVDPELSRERVRRLPRFAPPDDLSSLRFSQFGSLAG